MKISIALTAMMLILTFTASAQVGTARIEIIPPAPTPVDNISIRFYGDWPDSCIPQNPTANVADNQIRIATTRPGGVCLTVITPFNITVPVGRLRTGVYEVVVTTAATGSPVREIGRKVFTVGGISDGAFPLVLQRTMANRGAFYVYENGDSGFNHGFPSGFFGNVDKIRLDSACVANTSTANGCEPQRSTRLDRERGTVLRLLFDPLSSGEFAGLNFEEPENWGLRGRPPSRGYDLRGATDLVFDVNSPNGIRVQFGVGGRVTEFMTIPGGTSFNTMRIPLNTLRDPATGLPSPPDLSAVHILFAVVTNVDNAPNGGILLLDNIRFEPVPEIQQREISFPLANQTFGVAPVQNKAPGRVPIPPDQLLQNLTTIYESSLTLLALLHRGTQQDLEKARMIADAFHYALSHENTGLPLPVAADRSTGLHSGYSSGDLAFLNDQAPPALAKAGEARLAGFSASKDLCGPTGYCYVLDGATGGNQSFAILALAAAAVRLNNPDYLNDAETIGRWIVDRLTDQSGTGFGGYFLGYPDEGVPAPKPLLMGKSVENNADIFTAFSVLALLAKQRGRMEDAAAWTARANVAGDFVMQMYDQLEGRFYAGTVPVGLPSDPIRGICSGGQVRGNERINTCDFLDSNSFTTLAMAASPRYRAQIDWRRPVQFILANFAQMVNSDGQLFIGFNIVKTPSAGPSGIAWEFTAQTVVAMNLVDSLYREQRFKPVADFYLNQLRRAQAIAPFGDGLGVVAATMWDGDQLPPIEQCLSTPFQCIPQRVGLAATTWAIYAERNFNPLVWPWPIQSVSAASFIGTSLAGESIVAAFGANLANTTADASSLPLPTMLGGSTVKIRDSANIERPAQLFRVSPNQINYYVPSGLAAGDAVITISSGDGVTSLGSSQITAVAPGLFAANANGQGVPSAVALRIRSGMQIYEPVARFDATLGQFVPVLIDLGPETDQVFLILYGTGIRNRSALSAVTCRIGGVDVPVSYAGVQGDFVGLDQVNVGPLPRSLAGRGEVDVVLTVDGKAANTVRVGIR